MSSDALVTGAFWLMHFDSIHITDAQYHVEVMLTEFQEIWNRQ